MNTDNMAISGETIDYGPCAFMDAYAPGTVFSSIDHQGRYAYANQPLILGWNLARLAETLLPLLDTDEDRAVAIATEMIEGIAPLYAAEWLAVMRQKLGLAGEDAGDRALAEDLLALMAAAGADWTLTFRRLASAVEDAGALRPLFADPAGLDAWLPRWRARLAPDAARQMNRVNPIYIPRNHMVEDALVRAPADMAAFDTLLAVITDPFTEKPGLEGYALPAPASFGALSHLLRHLTVDRPQARPQSSTMNPRHDIHDRLAASLREARKTRGLSLDAVAKLSGVSRSMVSQIERGESSPTVATLWNLTQALKVDFAGLLEGGTAPGIDVVRAKAAPVIDGAAKTCASAFCPAPMRLGGMRSTN